jgi:hypothetical protein
MRGDRMGKAVIAFRIRRVDLFQGGKQNAVRKYG